MMCESPVCVLVLLYLRKPETATGIMMHRLFIIFRCCLPKVWFLSIVVNTLVGPLC